MSMKSWIVMKYSLQCTNISRNKWVHLPIKHLDNWCHVRLSVVPWYCGIELQQTMSQNNKNFICLSGFLRRNITWPNIDLGIVPYDLCRHFFHKYDSFVEFHVERQSQTRPWLKANQYCMIKIINFFNLSPLFTETDILITRYITSV